MSARPSSPPARRKAALAVPVLLLLLAACGKDNTYVPPPPPEVTVSLPEHRTVTDTIELTGNTQSSNTVNLVARVTGYLQSVNFKDGAIVKKGDLLFVIEPEPYEANVQLAQATLEQQQATLTNASSEYERQQRLIKQKATSESDVENWQAQRDGAKAAVDQANANLEIAKINLGYTRILAPFDGRVGRRQVDPGNLVGPGGTTQLATIDQLAPIYVYFNVDEQEVLRLRAGLRAAGKTLKDVEPVKLGIGLQNETGYPHEATLDFVATDVDQSTGTLQARGVIANQDYVFLPGLFVRVQIPVGRTEGALLVPDRAVGSDQRGPYLLVVGKDDVVAQRTVQIGALHDGMRVIGQGLSADDRVVIDGLQRAIPGSKVSPHEAPTTPAKPQAQPGGAAATDQTSGSVPSAASQPAAQQ